MLALGIYLIAATTMAAAILAACWHGSRAGVRQADRYFATRSIA